MASRFLYQSLRGLTLSFSLALPVSIAQVHSTSLAVKGFPSCQVTPSRSGKVSSVPSSFHDQPVARSGTIELRLFCFTCWSNMTRLLKTPIIGRSEMIVASSWIDILAGLSGSYIFRMPPGFCANATSAADSASNSDPAAASTGRGRFISVYLPLLCRAVTSWSCGDTRDQTLLFHAHFLSSCSKCRPSWQFTTHGSKRQDGSRRAPFFPDLGRLRHQPDQRRSLYRTPGCRSRLHLRSQRSWDDARSAFAGRDTLVQGLRRVAPPRPLYGLHLDAATPWRLYGSGRSPMFCGAVPP